jgi:phosphoglycerate dehydrogenase-like enzyme
MARLAQAFGMQVLCWTRQATPERAREHGVQLVTLKELFQQADVVTLHVRQTPETERIITRELLELLKPGAIFVNTARGELVDNQALAELLRAKKLGAAGLDVFDTEPIERDSPFLGMENVVLTPHVAYNTREANGNILKISVDNVVAFFSGHPQNVVNVEVLKKR